MLVLGVLWWSSYLCWGDYRLVRSESVEPVRVQSVESVESGESVEPVRSVLIRVVVEYATFAAGCFVSVRASCCCIHPQPLG